MIKPNIQLLAENYVPAAKRFERTSTRIESMETDIAQSHSPVPSWAVFYCRFKQLFKDTGLLMISGMEQQQFKENPS